MWTHALVLAALFVLGTQAPALTETQETPAKGIHARPAPLGTSPDIVQVDINPAHVIQTFRPNWALGSTVDKEPAGSIPSLYSNRNVDLMLAAGYGWLSYRLFTELSDQDWHWNPLGRFS